MSDKLLGRKLGSMRVIASYRTQYHQPIEVEIGTCVNFLDRVDDGEFPGWKWAQAADGRSGWVPRAFFGPGEGSALALRSYSARELDVEIGSRVRPIEEFSGWLRVIDEAGREGWIPASCVEPRTG